jgi:hypothetical protein
MDLKGLTSLRRSSRSNCHDFITISRIQPIAMLPIVGIAAPRGNQQARSIGSLTHIPHFTEFTRKF